MLSLFTYSLRSNWALALNNWIIGNLFEKTFANVLWIDVAFQPPTCWRFSWRQSFLEIDEEYISKEGKPEVSMVTVLSALKLQFLLTLHFGFVEMKWPNNGFLTEITLYPGFGKRLLTNVGRAVVTQWKSVRALSLLTKNQHKNVFECTFPLYLLYWCSLTAINLTFNAD